MKMRWPWATTATTAALLGLTLAVPAFAQPYNEDLTCRDEEEQLDAFGYLRALSLDLRGKLPSEADYARIGAHGTIPDSLIDEWLATDEFADRAVRHHRELIWNNIGNVQLVATNTQGLGQFGSGVYVRGEGMRRRYRGDDVTCLDEPATFTPDGDIEYTMIAGAKREGWVWVEPYWAPGTRVKVCAYDAQAGLVSSSHRRCDIASGNNETSCGCGPNLRWCVTGDMGILTRSMSEDVDRRVAALIKEDRPYSELFTSRRAFVNGPLVHFWKHLTSFPAGVQINPNPMDPERLPDLPWSAKDTWVAVELPAHHSGILTSPVWLLRHQTNRARANRFLDAFLCSAPAPPPGGLPALDPRVRPDPDLQKRDGCRYCHLFLEPTGAYWGRWPERGAGYLNPTDFPVSRDDCATCAQTGRCSSQCQTYYLTTAFQPEQEPFVGMLKAYEFRRDEHKRNVEAGTRLLILSTIVDNRFPTCTARRAGERLLGRKLAEDDEAWLTNLTQEFLESGQRYRALVKAIVKSPVYRRVR